MKVVFLATLLLCSFAQADIIALYDNLYVVNPKNGKTSRVQLDQSQSTFDGTRPTVKSGNIIELYNNLYIVDPETGTTTRIDLDQSQSTFDGTRPVVKP